MQIVLLLLAYLLVLSLQPINAFCPKGGDEDCSCHGNSDGEGGCRCFGNPWYGQLCNECGGGKYTVVHKDEKCAGHGGSATVSVTTSWTPAQVLLDGFDNSFPMSPTLTYTNLPPDQYDLEVFGTVDSTDFCTIIYTLVNFTYSLTINPAPEIIATTSSQEGECTSSFTINAHGGNGGTVAFMYSINGVDYQNGATFSDLPPDTYTYYIKDTSVTDDVCIKKYNITLQTSSIAPTPHCDATPPKCFGGLGQVTISATGGSSNYLFSLDSGPYNATTTYWEPAGSYHTCSVQDDVCTANAYVTVPASPSVISVVPHTTNETCPGSKDGSVTFSSSGGTGNILFSLDGQNYGTEFSNLETGTYTFFVKDENGCTTATTNSFFILTTHAINRVIQITNDTCSGSPSGSISFSVSTNQYLLSFNGSAYENTTWQFSGLAPGNYSYSIMDQNHCMANSSVTIYQIPRGPCAKGICGANAICTDSSCGYVCTCNSGYAKNGTVCQDIDECALDNGGCDYRPYAPIHPAINSR